MKHDLVDKEQKARSFIKEGRLDQAIAILADIIAERPDWEHGSAYYQLACCHESLKQLTEARRCFLGALSYEPENVIYLEGYAAFLYRYGEPAEALETYKAIIHAEDCRQSSIDKCMPAMTVLAQRIGLSQSDLNKELAELSSQVEDDRTG